MESNSNFISPEAKEPGNSQPYITGQIESILSEFQKISLQEMDAVQLQNRMDTKYMFHISKLPYILDRMKADYFVFEINNFRMSPYRTLYFDDEKWSLYLMHHNQKANRFKLRYRTYVSSDLSFFEVKYKNNKERTVKERIKVPEISYVIDGKAGELMREITDKAPEAYSPKIWVNYSRITFVSRQKTERVTIDINLSFIDNEKEFALNNLVIAEVKQGRATTGSSFLKILKELGIRSGSISKYCFGAALLHQDLKRNNFKAKLNTIEKLINTPQH
jgi:hypothetical protein